MRSSMRRAGGALACLLTLHLGLLVGDPGCRTHPDAASTHAVAPQPAPPVDHAHHGHPATAVEQPSGAPAAPEPAESCGTPARTRCCEALASCAVEVAFAQGAERLAGEHSAAPLAALPAAPSRSLLSPDTPPPKA